MQYSIYFCALIAVLSSTVESETPADFSYDTYTNKIAEYLAKNPIKSLHTINPQLKYVAQCLEFPNVLEILPFPTQIGFPIYTHKFGAMIEFAEPPGKNYYGFVACGITTSEENSQVVNNLFIMGCSQRMDTRDMVTNAWNLFAQREDAFGQLVALPTFYSGREKEAEDFYRQSSVLTSVKTIINSRLGAFKFDPIKNSAWFIKKGDTKLVVSCFESKDKKNVFFVAGKQAATNIEDIVVGPFQRNTNTMMQNLSDYVQETYFLEPIEQEYKPYIISMSEKSVVAAQWKITSELVGPSAVDALIFVVDFAARALGLLNRNDPDITPYINKGIAVIHILVHQHGIEDMPTLCAALLHEIPQKNMTLMDIENHFGFQVRKIVEKVVEKRRLQENMNSFRNRFTKPGQGFATNSKSSTEVGSGATDKYFCRTAKFDGKYAMKYDNYKKATVHSQAATLDEIWEERSSKLPKEMRGLKFEPSTFVDTITIGQNLYDIYMVGGQAVGNALEANPPRQVFRFTVEYRKDAKNDYKDQVGIVGELRKTGSDEIKNQMHQDYADAEVFKDIYVGNDPARRTVVEQTNSSERKLPNYSELSDVAKLTQALLFAAQRHSHERRKDENKRPYINHPINVAKIVVKSGRGKITLDIIIACLLHDTIENTITTALELEAKFNKNISEIVDEVSDDPKEKCAEKKKIGHVDKAPKQSKGAALVKGGDRDNGLGDLLVQMPAPPVYTPAKLAFTYSISRALCEGFEKNIEDRILEWNKHEGFVAAMRNIIASMEKKYRQYPIWVRKGQ